MQHIESETMNEPWAEMSQRTFRIVVRTYKQKGEKSDELREFSNHLPSVPRSSKAKSGISADDTYSSECNGAIASSSKPSRLLGAGLEMLKRSMGTHLTNLPSCSRIQIPASLPVKIPKVNCHYAGCPRENPPHVSAMNEC
jgi:hypothetical protein